LQLLSLDVFEYVSFFKKKKQLRNVRYNNIDFLESLLISVPKKLSQPIEYISLKSNGLCISSGYHPTGNFLITPL